ncbi:MAG TPA: class II aldolase/adducin family protein [Firmicutes bacterium]|nr:class II aldolase/adducin family protein [Candidatus Fermentithermobacillaceae bacterium]
MLAGLRKQVLDVSMELRRMQMARGTSGNVSARDPESGLIAITPSAIPYEVLRVTDIAIITPAGEIIHGNHRPSSETPMHTAVYRLRPDVNGIVHTHSLYATVFSVLNKELPVVTVPLATFGPVPIAPFRLPGSQALADEVARCLGVAGKSVLLQNHGALCAGSTVGKALECAAYTEEGAQVAYLAHLAGGLNPIPDEYIAVMRDISGTEKAL